MSTKSRQSQFEKLLQYGLDSVPFLLLGVAPQVLAGYFLVFSVNGFFQHCNIELRYGWLNYLVGSADPQRHHLRQHGKSRHLARPASIAA